MSDGEASDSTVAARLEVRTDARDAVPSEGEVPGALAVYSQGTAVVSAGDGYDAGPLHALLLGDDYRDVWTAHVEVPVLDMDRTAGGLTVDGGGGGLQTNLLFLEGDDGRGYILRGIDKDAGRALPEEARHTIVEDVTQDQISSLNPYGAFIVAPLAKAAGVLHTAPKLVLVPDDPRLGAYHEAFAGRLALIERNVTEPQPGAARFAFAEEVVDTEAMLERLQTERDAAVDERAFARARLFDMLIGDRDRHDEQWFWVVQEAETGTRFLPLPIDRDFAFSRFDGWLIRLARSSGRKQARKLVYFDRDIDDLYGLNLQGAKLDLRLPASLTREDWIDVADSLRRALPDEVIEAAVRSWPEAVYDEIGPGTAAALQARRDRLPETAEAYYELLARTVDVVGTDHPERFEVTRKEDGRMEVAVYTLDDRGEIVSERYRRVFLPGETEEVHLYGEGGADHFVVDGDAEKGVRLRALGGPGTDTFADHSAGAAALNAYYDARNRTVLRGHARAQAHLSGEGHDHAHELHRFAFDQALPVASLDYDSDQGLFLGGGLRFIQEGFRKEPYAAAHTIVANYAPRSRGFNLHYAGDFVQLWAGWNGHAGVDVRAVDDFRNYYGLGNETAPADRERYRARMQHVTTEAALSRTIGPGTVVAAGPAFEYANIEPPEGRSEQDPQPAFSPEQFTDTYFGGVTSSLVLDTRAEPDRLQTGWRWVNRAGVHAGLRQTDEDFVRLASALSYYHALPVPGDAALALRVGGATNIGDFAFFQANTLGGRENLRGYGTTRFAGRSSLFANAELRFKLADVNIYLARGPLGLLGFVDHGRVWVDGESSDLWHRGYGGGIWYRIFDRYLLTATAGFSEEGPDVDLSFGFLF